MAGNVEEQELLESSFHGVMDIYGVMMRVKLMFCTISEKAYWRCQSRQEFMRKTIETCQLFKMTPLTAYVFDALAELEMLNDSRLASNAYKIMAVLYHRRYIASVDGSKRRNNSQIKQQWMFFVQFDVMCFYSKTN